VKVKADTVDPSSIETSKETPAFTVSSPKSQTKERGPNKTPKSEMRIQRDFDHLTWTRQFKSLCAKWDREAYSKRNEVR